jgi:hypothetical protein
VHPLGADLSEIGKPNTPVQLLEATLDLSKTIDANYLAYVVETDAGRHSGVLIEKSVDAIVLKDERNELIRIPAGEGLLLVTQQKSLMPDLLFRNMTAREVGFGGFSAFAQIALERTVHRRDRLKRAKDDCMAARTTHYRRLTAEKLQANDGFDPTGGRL